MAKQAGKKFVWVIKNFSSLQCEKCCSVPVLIGDCKWRVCAYPKGKDNVDCLSMYLQVADFESLPSGWRIYANFWLTIINKLYTKRSVLTEFHHWFDQKSFSWGIRSMIPVTKLNDEKEGFLVNGELITVAEVEVLEVIGKSDESEEAIQSLKKVKREESTDLLKEASSVKESMDVNGFQVLPSQVEYVRRIFERHPDIAVEFGSKNQYLRNACMNSLLGIIETLRQSLEELSNEHLLEADIALTYVKEMGFKVDWLKKKLDQLKEKKEKELSALAQLQKAEEVLQKMKAELSATRAPLSLDDVV